jgi:hypothetical protein
MILMVLLLAFLVLTLLAGRFGVDSRDGRDWSHATRMDNGRR